MSVFSPPRVAANLPSRLMAFSDSSHTYESAASSGTHFSPITPLPRGAEPPQVNPPITEYYVGFNPNERRKAHVLRKLHPPPSISNPSTRNGNLIHKADRCPAASAFHSSHHGSFDKSVLPPTPSYEVSKHSRSFDNSYESPTIDRPIPPAEHAPHTFGTLTRLTNAFERPHMKIVRVEDAEGFHAITQNDSHSRTSVMINLPVVHRDKPLPPLPDLSPPFNGFASSTTIEPLPSHRLPPHIYPSYPLPFEDGEAAPLSDHFVARPSADSSPGYGFKLGAHTDVGHAKTWFDSDHPTSVARYASSDTNDHVSEPQYRHSPNLRSRKHPPVVSTTSRPASRFPEFATPSVPLSHPTHSAALDTSEPPLHHTRDTLSLTHGLSWGRRIIRTLSITLFRKNTTAQSYIKHPPYLASDPGHKSTFHQPVSVTDHLAPLSQHKPWDRHPHHSSRKLRKPAPLTHSRTSTRAPIIMSRSSPALYSHVYRSRESESVLELCDAPSQNSHSDFDASPKSSPNRKHSMSNPILCATASTSVTQRSGLITSTPTLPAQWIRSQQTTPRPSSPRKLVKRHARRKIDKNAVDEHISLTLLPLRTQSPINLDFNSPGFSDVSRSHSASKLRPTDSTSGDYLSSRYVVFPTDSSSESPHLHESPPGDYSWSEHHYSLSKSQALPSLLHSESSRRWTLAVFDASEEQMVEELDRLRNVGWGPGFQGELVRVKSRPVNNTDAGDREPGPGASLAKEELEEWLVARKALMVCREIMRTEKNYREGLIKLQRGETLKSPPPLLLRYLPALISASLAFSVRLDDDPSTYGVSVAFLGAEDTLEVALVAWSGIVGDFFGAATGKQRRTLEKEKKGTCKSKKDRNKATGAPVLPPVIYGNLGRDSTHSTETKTKPSNRRTSMPSLSLLTSSTETSPAHRYFSASTVSTTVKLPTVQDLAIQPTQRVMRYVLLYKDLLNSTPTMSPARGLVERALEGANRIAERCNRAQNNAAFLT